jgi:ribosomal protein S18 acetylase RimI-like enzyme
MSLPAVRAYRDGDRAAVIEALVGLQDQEVALHDTRLAGRQIAEPYLVQLLGIVAQRAGAVLVAETGGRFAGFVACYVAEDDVLAETPDSNRYGYVSDIFVVPERRGSGLAPALLAAAERHLAATGVARLRIGVLAANRMACRAYEKVGFEPYEIVYEKRVVRPAGANQGAPA